MATAKRLRLSRPTQSMPTAVREALNDRGLMAAYKARPPYQRNDYLSWIKSAKLPETREKRVDQMLRELKSGSHYMKMAWPGRARSAKRHK